MHTLSHELSTRQMILNIFRCLYQSGFLSFYSVLTVYSVREDTYWEKRVIVTLLVSTCQMIWRQLQVNSVQNASWIVSSWRNFPKRMERDKSTCHRSKHGKSMGKIFSMFLMPFFFAFCPLQFLGRTFRLLSKSLDLSVPQFSHLQNKGAGFEHVTHKLGDMYL